MSRYEQFMQERAALQRARVHLPWWTVFLMCSVVTVLVAYFDHGTPHTNAPRAQREVLDLAPREISSNNGAHR